METVRRDSTSMTVLTQEFEADVRVAGKDEVADGVVALTLRQIADSPLPRGSPGAHVDLVLDGVPVRRDSTSMTVLTQEFEADVRVAGKDEVADGVVALTLRQIADSPLPRGSPGAHVDLVLDGVPTRQYSLCGDPADHHLWRLGILRDANGGGGSRFVHVDLILDGVPTRQYSLCGDPADHHLWRLGILRDANGGGGSRFVHDRLRAGDTVRVRGPRNNFELAGSLRYQFIAGGIGITPILPMIAAASAAGADWRLLYGGRYRASMAFLPELARYGDRVTVAPQDETGLLDLDSLLGTPQPDTLVYCCGPEPLLAAVEARCAAWPARSLHVERFAARPLTAPVRAEAFEVELAASELTLTIPPDRSILDVVGSSTTGCERETRCGSADRETTSSWRVRSGTSSSRAGSASRRSCR